MVILLFTSNNTTVPTKFVRIAAGQRHSAGRINAPCAALRGDVYAPNLSQSL
ncbi:Hypothetical protein RAK1035_3444 [Roseovarius sp. AK1035]|uniref:hypothetical protein n=1 Tax=Roseovarius mucosus TaxID=215743 RepID=UPI00031F750D|nr:Hypothetical protein RAK1035_3444 [Roseovarius sp. AK1035]